MSDGRSGWVRKTFVIGPLAGWAVGMVWWAGLMLAFGPSAAVTHNGVRPISVASRMVYAPVAAVPFALLGLVAGAFASAVGGTWVPTGTGLGLVAGGMHALATNPSDGWLAVMMPIACVGGGLAGAFFAAVAACVWRAMQPPGR